MRTLSIIALILASTVSVAVAESINPDKMQIIAVLENSPERPSYDGEPNTISRNVRLLYSVQDGQFSKISLEKDKYPDRASLYYQEADARFPAVAMGRKDLGKDNVVLVADKIADKLTKLMESEKDSYCQWMEGCTKPLLLTSQPYEDPEKWQLAELELPPELLETVIKTIPKYNSCKKIQDRESDEKSTRITDLEMAEAYNSSNNSAIISYRLKPALNTCQYVADDTFSNYWFYLKDGNLKYIDKNIAPIAAGDFNNDGKSEWLFGIYDYNHDGYTLFTDEFKNRLTAEWVYH